MPLTESDIQQMVSLAETLQREHGGVLDDSAILAISEATGAPEDYVRLAVKVHAEKGVGKSPVKSLRANFLTLDPSIRRYVSAGVLATNIALMNTLEAFFQRVADLQHNLSSPAPIFGMMKLVAVTAALYNLAVSRERKTAVAAGIVLGGVTFATDLFFRLIFQLQNDTSPYLLFGYAALGGVGGYVLFSFVDRFRNSIGLKDPVAERKALINQLVELQDKLKSNEQSITFLSVDIVGSTKMKQLASPIAIEYTFSEYHTFVGDVTKRFGGRLHSTAGDGVTCAFDSPAQAYGAARNLQAGIIELNTFRNKTNIPLRLRAGIHTGQVVLPDKEDIGSLNFAQVIDLAAHFQKYCPEGGIAVSEAAAVQLPGGPASVGTEEIEVSGVRGFVWVPRAQMAIAGPAKTPALPQTAATPEVTAAPPTFKA